jgi:hypothetical protein
MFNRLPIVRRLSLALTFAMVASLFIVPFATAQSADPLMVRVETPATGSLHRGNITFTGLAVNGATNQPATRVAVYDNEVRDANYIADVSMDTMRPLAAAFSVRTGTAQIGWTLIFDSNRIADGRHTLHFVAHFPGGATAVTTTEVVVANYFSPQTYRGAAYYAPDLTYNGVYYVNGVPYYNNPYYTGGYPYMNGVRFSNGVPSYNGIYYYNGVYYYNGAPYYNGANFYSGTPSYAVSGPNGYWYNGVYYPTGAITPALGWYYVNGVWLYRPNFSLYR